MMEVRTYHSLVAQPLLRLVVLEYCMVMHHKMMNCVRQIFRLLHLIGVVQKENGRMYLLLVLDDEHPWACHVFLSNREYVVAYPSMYLRGESWRRVMTVDVAVFG